MSTSFFLLIRKLKDQHVYSRELSRQYSLFRSVSDQVDNIVYKNYIRNTNYRVVMQEKPSILKLPASQYKPYIPPEGTPPGGPITDSKFSIADSAIDAAGNDGTNLPRFVNDSQLTTRWSHNAIPSWIRIDLGESKRVSFIKVAWWKGTERKYGYTISGGDTPQAITTLKQGTSTGQTNGFETYDFTDRTLRYIVLWINTNTKIDGSAAEAWASIAELEIWGSDLLPPPGPPPPPAAPTVHQYPHSSITVSSNDQPETNQYAQGPSAMNDNNFQTYWWAGPIATNPFPQWARIDLGSAKLISHVVARMPRPASAGFTWSSNIKIQTSSDGTSFTDRHTETVTDTVDPKIHTFEFPDITARYVRYYFVSRIEVETSLIPRAGLTELQIWGHNALTPLPSPPPLPPGTPPPVAEPLPSGNLSLHLNFNNTLQDDSGAKNDAIFEGGTMRFGVGQTSALQTAIDLNPLPLNQSSFSPLTITPLPTPTIPEGITSKVKYYGGPVFNRYNVQVHFIWWGSDWNSGQAATDKAQMTQWINDVFDSQHFEGLWEYGWIKKPVLGSHITVTSIALFSGTHMPCANGNGDFTAIHNFIEQLQTANTVPNPDLYGESWTDPEIAAQGYKFDYKHHYIVMLPPGKHLPCCDNTCHIGATSIKERSTDSKTLYTWSAINPPEGINLSYPQYSRTQMWCQGTFHELFHAMHSPFPTCTEGYGGYIIDPDCTSLQHPMSNGKNCGAEFYQPKSGSDALVSRYWSDQLGSCAAPGIVGQWVPPPTGTATSITTFEARATNIITDYGGPVYNKYQPEVWLIFWGSGWNSTSINGWDQGNQVPGDPAFGPWNAVTARKDVELDIKQICAGPHFNRLSQYRNILKPRIAGVVLHTATSQGTAGTAVTTAEVVNVINNCITSGQVPDPRDFDEVTAVGSSSRKLDRRHIYSVILPPTRNSVTGSKAFAHIGKIGTDVYYMYNATRISNVNRVFDNGATGTSGVSSIWGHEMMHSLTHPGLTGCNPGGGFLTDACQSINHSFLTPGKCCCGGPPGAGMNKVLPEYSAGRNLFTESYYSDLDGRCVDPATATGPNPTSTVPPPPPPIAKTSRIKDWGGPVCNKYNIAVHNIFWGSEWNSTSTASWYSATMVNAVQFREDIATYEQAVIGSQHWDGLWQYRNIKKPKWGGSVVHTSTALPSGGVGSIVSQSAVESMIQNCINAGQVPNPDSFDETISGVTADYQHVFYVWLPPSRKESTGTGAYASRDGNTLYCVSQVVPPTNAIDTNLNGLQAVIRTWSHELKHTLTQTAFTSSFCASGAGFANDACQAINHAFLDGTCCCNKTAINGSHYALVGTSVPARAEAYWSDMDGRCIRPGSAEDTTWIRPPGATPPPAPIPNPPSPPGVPPPAPPSQNPPTSETYEKLWIPFSNTTQILVNTATGFSVFGRIYPYTIATTLAGHYRCLWIKQDDRNNGAHALIGPDGTLYFHVKYNGTRYKVRTAANTLTYNAWFECWFSFVKEPTPAAYLYVNNVKYTLPSSADEAWNDTHSHFIIGNYHTGSAIRPYRGRLDDWRLYREGAVLDPGVKNMWENGFTTEAIPLDEDYGAAIAGFVKLGEPLNNDVFVHDDVSEDQLIVNPPPPPITPGTDNKPASLPAPPLPDAIPPDDNESIIHMDDIPPPPTPPSPPLPEPEDPPTICNPEGEV